MTNGHRFNSLDLLTQELSLFLPEFNVNEGLLLGKIATNSGISRSLPIAIEVRIKDWTVYHASLPGSSKDNKNWIDRKARVVNLRHHSTLYEKLNAEEQGIDWFKDNQLSEKEYAIHGGGLPIITTSDGFQGSLIISGLEHIEDHIFGVEVLAEYLTHQGQIN